MPHRYRAARTNGARSDEHPGGRGPRDRQRPPEHPGGDAPVADDAPRPAAARDAPGLAEQRFRSYFELGLIGMAITSPTKGCIEVNDEICRILGYERHELWTTSRWTLLDSNESCPGRSTAIRWTSGGSARTGRSSIRSSR